MTSAKELRDKANKLLKKAQDLERKNLLNIGKLVKGHFDEDFENFEVDKFKEEVSKVLEN